MDSVYSARAMYQANDIKILHMETTSKCNATCPMCLRSVNGGKINPHLPLVELGLSEVQKILPESFVQGLDKVFMCGNYGDPAAASETLEIFTWLREVNPKIQLEIFSNGGLRSEKWWAKIAEVINKAVFAIDGLEDTNHLYRRGVVWHKVEKNIQAFVQAGGKARWDYIVFRHNEHQVEEARQVAAQWGVQDFQVKKTGRFFSYSKTKIKEAQEVWDKDGNVEYLLELPRNQEYVNKAFAKGKTEEKKTGNMKSYIERSVIDCKVAAEKSVYLTSEGFILPCCWLAIRMYPWYSGKGKTEIWKIFEKVEGGMDSVNALKYGIEAVIEGDFFQKVLPESWDLPSHEDGKLFACSKTCGRKEFDLFRSQFVGASKTQKITDKLFEKSRLGV